jgi:hypothetical protein
MLKARFYLVTLFPGFARLHRQLGFQFDLFRVGIGHPRICRVNVRQCPRFLGANRRIGMGASMLQFRPRRHCSSWTAPAFPSLLVTKPFTNASSFAPLGSSSEPPGGTVTPVQFRARHSGAIPASSRICAARSQKRSQIGMAGVKRPSYLPERTATWTSDLISAVGKRTT